MLAEAEKLKSRQIKIHVMKKSLILGGLLALSGMSQAQLIDECCLGDFCTNAPNPLWTDYLIPLNGNNFYFSDDTDLRDKVFVGYPCASDAIAKLNVSTAAQTNPGNLPGYTGAGYANSIAMFGESTYNAPNGYSMGVRGEASNIGSAGAAAGIYGKATSDALSIGVVGEGSATLNGVGPSYAGVFNSVFVNNKFNVGAWGRAGSATQANIGVFASVIPSSGAVVPFSYSIYPTCNIGIYAVADPANSTSGAPGPDWAGWFDGDVFINGTAYYPGMAAIASDRMFKHDIASIENASEIIEKLKPSTYYLNTDNQYGMNFSDKKQFGFISQEVEVILPELVEEVHKPELVDTEGKKQVEAVDYKGLNYIGFIALLTKGMQEQQELIEEMQAQIAKLSKNSDVHGKADGTNATNVTLSDADGIVLNQNAPNPFAESTTITYDLSMDFTEAQIIITNMDGRVIKTVDITKQGKGQLNVFASDLSSGIYSYSLVVDGQTIDTKSMVKN